MSFVCISSSEGAILLFRSYGLSDDKLIKDLVYKVSGSSPDLSILDQGSDMRLFHQQLDFIHVIYGIEASSTDEIHSLMILKLIVNVIQKECTNDFSQKSIFKASFDLVFAFDEILAMGYADILSVDKLEQILSLESANEVAHDMLMKVSIYMQLLGKGAGSARGSPAKAQSARCSEEGSARQATYYFQGS